VQASLRGKKSVICLPFAAGAFTRVLTALGMGNARLMLDASKDREANVNYHARDLS